MQFKVNIDRDEERGSIVECPHIPECIRTGSAPCPGRTDDDTVKRVRELGISTLATQPTSPSLLRSLFLPLPELSQG